VLDRTSGGPIEGFGSVPIPAPQTSPARRYRVMHCLRAPVGGLFRHVRDLARGQAARGLDVGIICDSGTGDGATSPALAELATVCTLGVHRVVMSRSVGLRDLSAVRRIAGICRPLDLDVVHGHGAKGGAYARIIAQGLGAKSIYTPHGGSLHYRYSSVAGLVFLGLEYLLRDRTDGFIFECRFSADALARKVGRPQGLVTVIHNGLRPDDLVAIRRDRADHEFVFVGELRDLKGVDVLLEATALVGAGRDMRLLIVGAGPDEARFRDQATRLGLDRSVTFSPPVFPARAAFERARCVILPSRSEAFPYVVLEAAAGGIPVIASAVGGIPEILGGDYDLLVPPGDPEALAKAMIRVLDRPEDSADRAAGLRDAIATRFTVDGMVSAALEVYSRLVQSP
jgi:glycosyltransferase involved in cell wall biosynthesis